MDEQSARSAVADTARMMARAGLAEAFGHVSARLGDGFVITTVDPLGTSTPENLIVVLDADTPPSGGGGAPLETPMHAEIYRSRPDVSGICRGHPRSVVAWGVGTEDLPLLHGLGALAGATVKVYDEVDLVTSAQQGADVADVLGDDSSVILRANGCLSVGSNLLEALTRLYFLEERARVAMEIGISAPLIAWGDRLRHTSPELPRAMAWVHSKFSAD